MRLICALVAASALLASAVDARAEPGIGEKVYDPYVRPGTLELEARYGRLTGKALNGEAGVVVEAEYGFNERFSGALVVEYEDHVGEKDKIDAVGVEGVFWLGQIPKLGIDTSLYLEYEQRIHNESGVGEAKLLLGKQLGPWQVLVNLKASRPFTDKTADRMTEFGYAASVDRELTNFARVGVEAFGKLGDDRRVGGRQAHYIGPMVKWSVPFRKLRGELEIETSYLFAAGGARDDSRGQARILLEWERRF